VLKHQADRLPVAGDSEACQAFFDRLNEFVRIHAVKLYRLRVHFTQPVPVLPCLDHEAMLHEGISPHAAAYVEDRDSGDLHEVVFIPAKRRVEIDIVSTAGEHSAEAHERLLAQLCERFPEFSYRVQGPSLLRGDRRVARACRAQIALRDVLMSADFDRLATTLDRLSTIGGLMEKESRVASWSVRTVTGPLLAVAGFLSYQILGTLVPRLGSQWVAWLQYATVGSLGAIFLYLGLKAVHLTEMANRVWKRTSEYRMILAEREKIGSESRVAYDQETAVRKRY
jgi:hypothetical protein